MGTAVKYVMTALSVSTKYAELTYIFFSLRYYKKASGLKFYMNLCAKSYAVLMKSSP